MSKPSSRLFSGTLGAELSGLSQFELIVALRTEGLDLREHPVPFKAPSRRQLAEIRRKVKSRTATREEYDLLMWSKRFSRRRRKGVREFWKHETALLKQGKPGTRHWSEEQRSDILAGKRPKFSGRTMQGHHAYSASRYPHLANRWEVIFPATHTEHLKGWHGGNWQKSLPGRQRRHYRDF